MHKTIFLAFAVLTLCFPSVSKSEITWGIETTPGPIAAGSTGTLTVFVSATGADQMENVDSFQGGFLASADSGSILSNLDFVGPAEGLSGFTLAPAGGFDLTNGWGAQGDSAVQMIGARLDLFEIDFEIDAGATELGSFNLDVSAGAGVVPEVFFAGVEVTSDASADPEAVLSYSAVPEPSSLALAVLALGGLVVRRRRS